MPQEKNEQVFLSEEISQYNLKRFDEAIDCFIEAIRKNSQFEDALCDEGVAFDNLSKRDETLKCFDEATKIEPLYDMAW